MTNCYLVLFDVWMTTDAAEQPTRYPVPIEAFTASDAAYQAAVKLTAILELERLAAGGVRLPQLIDVRPDVDGAKEKLKRELLEAVRGQPSERLMRVIFGEPTMGDSSS